MKVDINKLKVKFQGKILEIDLNKELSINEDIINSQLMVLMLSFPSTIILMERRYWTYAMMQHISIWVESGTCQQMNRLES